eukprot:1446947-Alexandrium_andersonii.AAC.1
MFRCGGGPNQDYVGQSGPRQSKVRSKAPVLVRSGIGSVSEIMVRAARANACRIGCEVRRARGRFHLHRLRCGPRHGGEADGRNVHMQDRGALGRLP